MNFVDQYNLYRFPSISKAQCKSSPPFCTQHCLPNSTRFYSTLWLPSFLLNDRILYLAFSSALIHLPTIFPSAYSVIVYRSTCPYRPRIVRLRQRMIPEFTIHREIDSSRGRSPRSSETLTTDLSFCFRERPSNIRSPRSMPRESTFHRKCCRATLRAVWLARTY